MRAWPALLVAPLLALADQSVAYMMAGWACAHQHSALPHVVHAVFLAAIAATAAAAWPVARPGWSGRREDAGFSTHRRDFVAHMAVLSAALSALVVVGLWIPQWMLSPCYG